MLKLLVSKNNLNKNKNKIKIGVCIRAKNEHKIICDWVKHYLKLDFDKIIIYDNLSVPSIKNILNEKNITSNKIQIIIDNCDYDKQRPLYQECVNSNKDLDWLLLCDSDEFLYIKKGTIKEFLNNFSSDTCTILINWLTYGTSNNNKYDISKNIFEQFTKREDYNHFWNSFVKSFIRPKFINNITSVHISFNKNYKVKNVYNEVLLDYKTLNSGNEYVDKKLSDNTNIVLVHYMTLDFESMLEKRNKNAKQNLGFSLENSKYTLDWYKSDIFGFKENNIDLRMLKI